MKPKTKLFITTQLDPAAQVAALHTLGCDYQGTFSPAESSNAITQHHAAAATLIEGKDALCGRLLLAYTPQAAAQRILFDTSDRGARDPNASSAQLLGGACICMTTRVRDILHCLGGVSALLPLLALLDADLAAVPGGGLPEAGIAELLDSSQLKVRMLFWRVSGLF